MHVHGSSLNLNAPDPYSVGNVERAAAASRAVEVRKRLLKKAEGSGEEAIPEESVMMGQWLDAGQRRVEGTGPQATAAAGKDPDFG